MAVDFDFNNNFWDVIEEAMAEVMTLAAEKVEKFARANIESNNQIDTRFMMGTTYTVTPKGSTYNKAFPDGSYVNKTQGISQREKAPEIGLPDEYDSLTAAAAPYAIYQEELNSFLYRALTDPRDSFDSLDGEVKL